MTCEVAVMNKYAVVLAADSAITTSSGNGNQRYSKGGNKIFQLSRFEPVGMMIYGSAMLDGVPWEIIIKNFREQLGATRYDALEDYATAFFAYIKQAEFFFPALDRDTNLVDHTLRSALDLVKTACASHPVIGATDRSLAERQAAWQDFAAQVADQLATRTLHPLVDIENIDQIFAEAVTRLITDPGLSDYLATQNLEEVIPVDSLADLACRYLYKCYDQVLPLTGIVFSGFGNRQYFPVVIQFDVWGFLKNDFLYLQNQGNSCEINHSAPSGILQFAMTSSIDTTGVGDI